jgi:hypothetical protein
MHYSKEPWMVRVDRFRTKGKWYDTWQIDMRHHYDVTNIREAVLLCWLMESKIPFSKDFFLVCLEPYHRNSHPVVVIHEENLR